MRAILISTVTCLKIGFKTIFTTSKNNSLEVFLKLDNGTTSTIYLSKLSLLAPKIITLMGTLKILLDPSVEPSSLK